ncbi:RNA polymerase III RPC4 [Toxoplasma gondii MAS]|uniref:RNA polymerase III RPC4 n=1 Tax=Toxoplasma gondii MAS TaxID=943118 RepID=A0A086QSW5_TOXGO|nr:RNA polymerase III RPC4 [Toxoplasma gondii MAS]
MARSATPGGSAGPAPVLGHGESPAEKENKSSAMGNEDVSSGGHACSEDTTSAAANLSASDKQTGNSEVGDHPRQGPMRRRKLRKIVDDEGGVNAAVDTADTSATSSEEVFSDYSVFAQISPQDSLGPPSDGSPTTSPSGSVLCPTGPSLGSPAAASSDEFVSGRLPRPLHPLLSCTVLPRTASSLHTPVSGHGGSLTGASLPVRGMPGSSSRPGSLSSATTGGVALGSSAVLSSLRRNLPEGAGSGRGRASVRFTPNLNRVLGSSEPSPKILQEKRTGSADKEPQHTGGTEDRCGRSAPEEGFAWTGMLLSSQKRQEEEALRLRNRAARGEAPQPSLREQVKTKSDATADGARTREQRSNSASDRRKPQGGGGVGSEFCGPPGRSVRPPKNSGDTQGERVSAAKAGSDSDGDTPSAFPQTNRSGKRAGQSDGKGKGSDDGCFDRSGWKREFGEELEWGMQAAGTDGSYLPMTLPFGKKPFPRRSAAAALMAADASEHFTGEDENSACDAPGFASFLLLQLPRLLPPLDKEAMRRQAVGGAPGKQIHSSVSGIPAAPVGEKAGSQASGSAGAPLHRVSPIGGDPVTLSELPEGAVGRLLVHRSGRVVWCLGGTRESPAETSQRRKQQRKAFPVCPWEAPKSGGGQAGLKQAGKGRAARDGSERRKQKKKHRDWGGRHSGGGACSSGGLRQAKDEAARRGSSADSAEKKRTRLRRETESNSDCSEKGSDEGSFERSPTGGDETLEVEARRRVRRIESSDDEDLESEKERTRARDSSKPRTTSPEKDAVCQVKKESAEANECLEVGGAQRGLESSERIDELRGRHQKDRRKFHKRETEAASGSYYFKIDVGCDCIFKQECAVMLKDTKEFVFLGSCSQRLVVAPHIEKLLHASSAEDTGSSERTRSSTVTM